MLPALRYRIAPAMSPGAMLQAVTDVNRSDVGCTRDVVFDGMQKVIAPGRAVVELEHAVPVTAVARSRRAIVARATSEVGLGATDRERQIRVDVG